MEVSQLVEYRHVFEVIEDCRVNAKFINENSTDSKIRNAYNFISQYKQVVKDYYKVIGYTLVPDSGFFYFTVENYESINKPFVNNYIDYIDIYRFLKMLNSEISSVDGGPFNASDMETKLNSDIELRTMVDKMSFLKKKNSNREAIDSIIKRLIDDGFAETTGAREGQFIILRSFKHVENVIEDVEYEL